MKNWYRIIPCIIPVLSGACACSQQPRSETTLPQKYRLEFQKADSDRIIYNKDKDSSYTLHVRPGDVVFNGNRSEIAVKFANKNNHIYSYMWAFNVNGAYPQSESKNYHFIIAQWWNGPAKGEAMRAIAGKQGPPFYFVVVKQNNVLRLQIFYGLQFKNRSKIFDDEIKTSTWYNVNAIVKWSAGQDGYANIKLNDKAINATGANKYNDMQTDFKVGLYRNLDNKDETEIKIKGIKVTEIKK